MDLLEYGATGAANILMLVDSPFATSLIYILCWVSAQLPWPVILPGHWPFFCSFNGIEY